MKECWLLSFPRSGNSWVRYCIEFLTKRSTLGSMEDDGTNPYLKKERHIENGVGKSDKTLETDFSKPPILYKSHNFQPLKNKKRPVIMLIRNYKEVLPRHIGWNEINIQNYIKIIKQIDTYSEEKLFIYYEDIITDFENQLKKILNFIHAEINEKQFEKFIRDIDIHKKKSIKIYERCLDSSRTKGKEIIFYSKGKTREQKIKCDIEIKKVLGDDLFNKYLKRYEEGENGS